MKTLVERLTDSALEEEIGELRRYIDESLHKNYVNSLQYAVVITEREEDYSARITLDMLTDGSDYSNFKAEDYLWLSELESGYILDNTPPVPTSFTVELRFDDENTVVVEKPAGKQNGTVTYHGQKTVLPMYSADHAVEQIRR
jgi:hypothetical protein